MVCIPSPSTRAPAPRFAGSLIPACALAGLLATATARAAPPADAPAPPSALATPPAPLAVAPLEASPQAKAPPAEAPRPLTARVDNEVRLFGSLELGRGFRFNNPYRLATQLGQTAESVSITATYADLGIGLAFGPPDGIQHGGAIHASFALTGVGQAVLTPTYLIAYRGPNPFLAYGRLGPSIVLTPTPTIGGELAGGFAWFLTGKVAIAGELVLDVYYGSGTYDVGIATYPILSGQLGLLVDHEFLP
ncbi:Hypothetical protein A7982_03484 [Minicystis rosea]|nr:Hypothetical protein A7982_03484 [Minicystis rosea]